MEKSMAYVPPHKRNQDQLPSPAGSGSSSSSKNRKSNSRWYTVGYAETRPPVRLRKVSVRADANLTQAMAIVKPHCVIQADSQPKQEDNIPKPWEDIADRLMHFLIPSVESARKKMEGESLQDSIKAHFVARAGTILFFGKEQLNGFIDEVSLRKLRRVFYTNVPSSYMENIVSDFVPNTRLQYGQFKDVFHVVLSDQLRHGKLKTIYCKCRLVEEETRLEPYKIELSPESHMTVDFSCLEKNMDLRLMFYSKKTLTSLTENEKRSIRDLIGSAIVDPIVKGGIRWPFRKTTSSDNRYRVLYVCHTKTRDYVNSSMRLRVRVAERGNPNFSTSTGEVTREITIKLKGICSLLLEKKLETAALADILKGEMKMLWDHFLQADKFIL